MADSKDFKQLLHSHKLPTAVLAWADAEEQRSGYAGCMDGVYQVDLSDGKFKKLDEHQSYVSGIALHRPSGKLISVGYDGRCQWFDLKSAKRSQEKTLHSFWAWDMALSANGEFLASVSGQYLAGGYKYEPKPQDEPTVKIVDAANGEVRQQFEHVPSVQAVAISHDSQFVAAGNIMGEVRVWHVASGKLEATFNTPDFTSWGIIKSHCYLGGVFALRFTPDDDHLLLAGMGPMRDPMAGNGKQRWQKFAWRGEARKVAELHAKEGGEGLMECLAMHPDGQRFLMGGRLRGGAWNVAMFGLSDGHLRHSLKTGYRVTAAQFSSDGQQLVLAGTQGQSTNGKPFGRLDVYEIS